MNRAVSSILVSAVAVLVCAIGAPAIAQDSERTDVRSYIEQHPGADQTLELKIVLDIPEGHYVYRASEKNFAIQVDEVQGVAEPDVSYPETQFIEDPAASSDNAETEVFVGESVITLKAETLGKEGEEWTVEGEVHYQACTDAKCFLPQNTSFEFDGTIGQVPEKASNESGAVSESEEASREDVLAEGGRPDNLSTLLAEVETVGRRSGYMGTEEFSGFLADARKGTLDPPLSQRFQEMSMWLLPFLVLLGGIGLNLTPCVLPMIPVNLSIIGAGTTAGSKRTGFMRGSIYGLAMTLAYGTLGLIVVLTGSSFGNLNASPWFNFFVAAVFIALGAALFGLFNIDLSRLSSRLNVSSKIHNTTLLAFFMGALSALLAGACVAPVVIAVLLVSTQAYDAGQSAALLLPFVLGLGMALPWPFAGAGLSILPRPGNWMRVVERTFGVIIIGLAVYFGYTGWSLYHAQTATTGQKEIANDENENSINWTSSLTEGIKKAEQEGGRPVLIYFWAEWCRVCKLMERTTFKADSVQQELQNFVLVKYELQQPVDKQEEEIREHFGVVGIPLYIIVRP